MFRELVFLLAAGYVRLPLWSYGRIEFHYLHSFTLAIFEKKEFLFWKRSVVLGVEGGLNARKCV